MRSRHVPPVTRFLAAGAALLTALAAPALAGAASSTGRHTAAVAVEASPSSSPSVPHYDHITVIMFTDHGYSDILHNKFAPTFNRLATEYGLASHYYTTADPDAADIMGLLAGNSYGVNDGSPYWDQRVDKPSLLSELDAAHLGWKEYVQDIPYRGYLGDCYPTQCQETDTLYNQQKFNPVPDLTSVADHRSEADKMVPASQLAADARDGRMPAFSFVDANECTNMHGGPPWCNDSPNLLGQPNDNLLVADGNAYLYQVTSEIMSGPQWKHGNDAIVVTWTEGTTNAGCCDADPGTGRVFTVVITNHGPRHLVDPTPFNHYSLLATIQHAFGLRCLQFTCDTKNVIPMARLFGGASDGPISWAGKSGKAPAGARQKRPPPATASGPDRGSPGSRGSPARASSAWKQVPSPNTGPNDNDLWSVSGRSAHDIWAVGSLLPNANATIVKTLALHYNGKRWSRVPTADVGKQANSFYGLATLPDGTAWATGIYTTATGHTGRALTEHWNGHVWTAVPAVNPGSADDMLYAAAAVRDDDVWAVGTYGQPDGVFHPLIERWNGRRWKVVDVAGLGQSSGMLTSVSSGADGVWAVGQLSDGQPDRQLLLHLVGGTWHIAGDRTVRSPGGAVASAFPNGIASSAHGLWVAGNDRTGHTGFETLVEAPSGTGGLRQRPSPDPTRQDNYLQSVTAVGGGAEAWAVGDSVPPSTGNALSLIEHGSASGRWTMVPSPDPGSPNGNTILDGVFALSAHNIWAVGTYDGKGGMRTLVLHYTG